MNYTREQYRDAARALHGREGELEIDDNTVCSGTDPEEGGQYIQAWVWVRDEDVREQFGLPEPEEDEEVTA